MVKRAIVPSENNLPVIDSLVSPVEMEITGMKVKVACLEKTTMALKLELKCAEMQVEAKNKVDKQKSKLIELMDRKVNDLEKKNASLINMVETYITNKQIKNDKMNEATSNMERLALKLEESDRMKRELKAHNDELRKMLNSVESKGTAIAKLAKEKLVKYKDENTRMQGELDDYKLKDDKVQTNEKDWERLNDLSVQVKDQVSAARLSQTPDATTGILASIDKLNSEILSMMSQLKENTSVALEKCHDSNDKLQSHVQQLRRNITELEVVSKATLGLDVPTPTQLTQLKEAIGSLSKLGEVTVE